MNNLRLKIKIKTLAAEARIIRNEERKLRARSDEERAFRRAARLHAKGKGPKPVLKGKPQQEETKRRKTDLRVDIRDHRQGVVREEARISHLAYGYLKGIPYKAMEQKCHESPPWDAVGKCVERFGGNSEGLGDWADGRTHEDVPAIPAPQEARAS